MAAQTQNINKFLTDNVGRSDKLALLLDYDGTLAPISPHPDLAVLPMETRELLNKISKCKDIFCSFISGRQADNVKGLVGIPSFTYAGSHGFEIIYPDDTRYVHTVPKEDQDRMKNMEEALKQRVCRDGAWVENKGKVITFHFRETLEELRPALIKEAEEIIRSHGLQPTDALCAIEVQPKVSWNKGYAGEFLLKNKFGEDWNTKVKAIFIGDDISDEKLMELCKGRVLTFRVSPLKNIKTASDFQLMSLREVVTVLRWIENQYC